MKIYESVQITMNHDWTGRLDKLIQNQEWREFAQVQEGLGYRYKDCKFCEWNDSTIIIFTREIEQKCELGGEVL